MPLITRIELLDGRCGRCGKRFKATPPAEMKPGTPFGPNIHALLLYLHHSPHISFERLARLLGELLGLKISDCAITNAFGRMAQSLEGLRKLIKTKLKEAAVIASDETKTRINGITQWQWTFVANTAVLHEIAPRRAKAIAEEVLGNHRPEVWVSDRYAGQQELAWHHQICLAHVLRDVQYAIDCGDEAFAPKRSKLLRWAIQIGKRRDELKDTTLAQYLAKAERRLDNLLAIPPTCTAGRNLQAQAKTWRSKYFLFMTGRRVPATINISDTRNWPFRRLPQGHKRVPLRLGGAHIYAGYLSLTSTARLAGISARDTLTLFTEQTLLQPEMTPVLPTK